MGKRLPPGRYGEEDWLEGGEATQHALSWCMGLGKEEGPLSPCREHRGIRTAQHTAPGKPLISSPD